MSKDASAKATTSAKAPAGTSAKAKAPEVKLAKIDQAPEDPNAKVVIYESTVSPNVAVRKNQEALKNWMRIKRIPFKTVDVSAHGADRDFMHANTRASDRNTLPQIFVGGQYRGVFDDANAANEEGGEALVKFLA